MSYKTTFFLFLVRYSIYGDDMKIYIDLVFIINFLLDFHILFIVDKTLKRRTKLKRIILASFVGSVTLLFLFIPISSKLLFLIKMILCFLMSICAFGYKNQKYTFTNMIYIYMTSSIFGGALFFLKENVNTNFFYVLLLLLSVPMIGYILISYTHKLKTNYRYYYLIKIKFNQNQILELNSFLDTGNKLIDPYTNKGIILVDRHKISSDVKIRSPIYVPFRSLNNKGLLECIKPFSVEINGLEFKNYLIGLSDEPFHIDGIDCILNYKLMEDLHV